MENILDWAKAREYRTGENPARWRGHLENLFPKRSQVQVVEHHPALPYQEMPGFLIDLRKRQGIAASSLEFLILTAARTEEVIEAPWHEINFKEKLWTIPAKRMKGKRIHRVPLTPSALAVLRRMKSLPGVSEQDYIFPGAKPPDPQSNNAMLALLERMKRDDITVHGFRSTFRDWAAEETNFPNHVVEMAMAHTIKSKVEGAYRRGELLEKRRALMIAWAAFCDRVRSSEI
jgi:integrase